MTKNKIKLIIAWAILLLPWVTAFVSALLGIWTGDARWIYTAWVLFVTGILTFVPMNVAITSILEPKI